MPEFDSKNIIPVGPIFELPELKAHPGFEEFHKAILRAKTKDSSTVELDMLVAAFPEPLRGQALLHVLARSIHFYSGNLLNFVKSRGIEEIYPDIFHNLEVAQAIRNRVFDLEIDPVKRPGGHFEVLKQAASHHGVEFTLDSVNAAFRMVDNDDIPKLGLSLIQIYKFSESEALDNPEVGDLVLSRIYSDNVFTDFFSEPGEDTLMEIVSYLKFDDVGALSSLMTKGFNKKLSPMFKHIDEAIGICLSKPFNTESLGFIQNALSVRPSTVVDGLLNLPDDQFFKQVRGRFIEMYIKVDWMKPFVGKGHDFDDATYIEKLDKLNHKLLSDNFVRNSLRGHSSLSKPSFLNMLPVVMAPRLNDVGLDFAVPSGPQIDRFADLVRFSGENIALNKFRDGGVAKLKEATKELLDGAFYEMCDVDGLNKHMPDADEVTVEFRAMHMAIRLFCECSIYKDEWTDASKRRITPITYNMGTGSFTDFSKALREITKSASEEEMLEAVGKRPESLALLIKEDLIDRKHMKKLPAKLLGAQFSNDLGL